MLATTATENSGTQQPCHVHRTAFPALLHISSSEILSTPSVKSLETWRGWGRGDVDDPLRFEHSPISCSHCFDQLRVSGLVMLIAKEGLTHLQRAYEWKLCIPLSQSCSKRCSKLATLLHGASLAQADPSLALLPSQPESGCFHQRYLFSYIWISCEGH